MRTGDALTRMVLLGIAWQAAMLDRHGRHDRGDVPGWVLVTLMSAILVSGLLVVAGPRLETAFMDALDSVVP